MARSKNRYEALFETLVRENQRAVLAFLRTMVKDPGLVDDIFQETMITAWNKFDEFDTSRPLGPWLRGIAYNLVRNAARTRSRDCLVFGPSAQAAIENVFGQFDGDAPAWEAQSAALQLCLEQLPPRSQRLLNYRYADNKNATQLAEQENCSAAAIRKQLQRIRQILADCIDRRTVATPT